MSKAILVIDTDDDTFAKIETGKIFVKRIYCCNEKGKPTGELSSHNVMAKIKPLPQKKQVKKEPNGINITYAEDVGYNACIDEILGEEE